MKRLELKNARRRFVAARDEQGVPHIEAESRRAALYGLGYLHATDRPTQILFARAVAAGTTSARIADTPQLFETDCFFRRAGLALRLDSEIRQLSDACFADVTAYCEGINDGMEEAGRSLPMWAARFWPQPWTQQSVLLIGNLMSFGGLAIGQQQSERLLLELIQLGIDEERLRELFRPHLDQADLALLRRIKLSPNLSDETLELITDLPRLAGSNAWAVAPRRSATGSALLASDPHLEVNRLPPIWYEASLRWDDRYVIGASLPGSPMFAVARTADLSWGVTYLKGDTSDHFIEDVRRGGSTAWQYRRGNHWHDFLVREEAIERKDNDPEQLKIFYNAEGTLECDPEQQGEGLLLSTAWTGERAGVGRAIGMWLDLLDCPSVAAAMDVVKEGSVPTLCFVFADRAGHIGSQGSGWIPLRGGGHSGLLPIPAWDEANHWQDWHPGSDLPSEYDPPRGFVSSANENVNVPGGPQLVTLPSPDYRKRRIDECLEALPQASLADMQALQYDVLSTQARDLLAVFLPHLSDGPLKERLANWDLRYSPESTEAVLFQQLYSHVILEVFGQAPIEKGGIGWRRMLYLCSRIGYSTMVLACVDRVLQQESSSWWRERDKGELIRRAAAQLELDGCPTWAEFNVFRLTNRFFEGHLVGRLFGFDAGEIPMPGCHATPFQGHVLRSAKREETFAPSYHFVTEMGSDCAWTNLPGGPSESRFSKFYKIDMPLWQAGEYKRLAPDRVDETED